jgi:hypothetical protein
MTPDQFRRLALSMPEAAEGAHHGHPDFRANGRIFASLLPDGARGMVKLSPAQQREAVHAHPHAFELANGAWGRAGCTYVRLAAATAEAVREQLTLAWQGVAQAPPARRARGPKPTSVARRPRPRSGKPNKA